MAFDPDKYLAEKNALPSGGFDPDQYLAEKTAQNGPSEGKSAIVGLQSGTLLGARPFVAGIAGGAGQAVGTLQSGEGGLLDRIKALPEAFGSGFSEARQGAREEEAQAMAANPKAYWAGNIGGSILTAPLLTTKGLQAAAGSGKLLAGAREAAKLGAGLGGAQALGNADTLGDAIEMVGTGALTGGALQIGGNAVAKYAPKVAEAAGRGATKLASGLTGIPEETIRNYARRADKIKQMYSASGESLSEAADTARKQITTEIQTARQELNAKIGQALDNPQLTNVAIDAKPLLVAIDDQIAKIGSVTAKFRPGEISELKNLRDVVTQTIGESGQIAPKALNELKLELQRIAEPAYMNGAAIFPKGDLAAKAAKASGAEAKRLLDRAVPEVASANQQLSRLHAIEANMNKNLIRAGKPEAALVGAGSGSNARNLKMLERIDAITGGTAVQQAKDLASAKVFMNAPINPIDSTGKALARMATGAGIGYITGGSEGATIGAALTSPMALKLAIDSGNLASRLARAVGGGVTRALPTVPAGAATAAGIEEALQMQGARRDAGSAIERRLERLRGKGNISKPGAG